MEELYLNKYHCKSAKLKFLNKIQKIFCENRVSGTKSKHFRAEFQFFY